MTLGAPPLDPTALDAEARSLATDRWRHVTAAEEHRSRAARLRRLADQIDDHADPLATVLDPVVDLHRPETWAGAAATAARQRLDRHEERCADALRSARGLAAELRAEAEVEAARARTDDELARDLLQRLTAVELELGRFDHI
jgi:hypothetical protein